MISRAKQFGPYHYKEALCNSPIERLDLLCNTIIRCELHLDSDKNLTHHLMNNQGKELHYYKCVHEVTWHSTSDKYGRTLLYFWFPCRSVLVLIRYSLYTKITNHSHYHLLAYCFFIYSWQRNVPDCNGIPQDSHSFELSWWKNFGSVVFHSG